MKNITLPKELTTLSSRLRVALKKLNVSQSELARRIDESQQVINYLCQGNLRKSKLTYEIADALGINGAWLANGEGSLFLTDDPAYCLLNAQKRVPHLEWEQIDLYLNSKGDLDLDTHSRWVLTDVHIGSRAFALTLNDKLMSPRFDQGTVLIIDPDRKHQHKSFVIAYCSSSGSVIFRQLIVKNNNNYLYPINSTTHEKALLSEKDLIWGVLAESRSQY